MLAQPTFHKQRTDLSIKSYVMVCHDAGAANILLSNEEANRFPAAYYMLSGPAHKKWSDKIAPDKLIVDIAHIIDQVDVIITGTGWSSNAEHNARILAKANNLHSIALIDHWVNYLPRFTREESLVLPDEIWVTDDDAYSLAQRTFPTLPVYVVKNHYLLNAKNRVLTTKRQLQRQVLYVLEPVHEDWGQRHHISEEFQALEYFKAFVQHAFIGDYQQIRLRLHPSETKEKYQQWVNANADLPIVFDHFDDIETSIANTDWVFGCESYGLIVAIACGKPVYSTIPHWAPKARLPDRALRHLRDVLPQFLLSKERNSSIINRRNAQWIETKSSPSSLRT